MKNFLLFLLFLTLFLEARIEDELGINVEKTSIYNEDGMHLRDYGASVRYQMNRYVIAPRFDLDYVNIADYEGVNALWRGSINGVYSLEKDPHWVPYALVGLGYEYVNPSLSNEFESHVFVQGGAGLSYRFKEGYSTHMEGRVLQILGGDNENNEVILGLGMSFPFGKKVKKTLPPPPPPVPVTPPAPVAPPPPKVEPLRIIRPVIVEDHQIMPYRDRSECAIKIDRPDRDRDGVEDSMDQCPMTPCEFSVDRYGCPIKTRLEIHFANNSSKIDYFSLRRVERFANFLLKNKGSMVKILGHTDSVGSEESNLKLSHDRAASVARELIRLGVSPARISIEGLGESHPIASNKTPEGRAKNRRIEAILSYPDHKR